VAEIDPFQQERTVDVLPVWHEAAERLVHGLGGACVVVRKAARDEQQERPCEVRPAPFGPGVAWLAAGEHRGDPALVDDPPPLGLPELGRLVEQIAVHLPADHGIALEQPLDHRVGGGHGAGDDT
jgi:hypothetical protein